MDHSEERQIMNEQIVDKFDFVDLNLGQLLSPEQIARIEEACQKAYDLGDDAGYARAHKTGMQIVGAFCRRNPDNTIALSDEELRDSCNGETKAERWENELGSYFKWKVVK